MLDPFGHSLDSRDGSLPTVPLKVALANVSGRSNRHGFDLWVYQHRLRICSDLCPRRVVQAHSKTTCPSIGALRPLLLF